jgi:LytTr DNA-binding domain
MLSILRQPFPSFYPSARSVYICALAGLSVFFVLFVMKPFGMGKYPLESRWWIALGYGAITFIISVLFTCLLPWFFPKLFEEKNWNVNKEIIFFILLTLAITMGNLIFSHWVDGAYINISNFIKNAIVTFSVAFIPISISVLIKQQRLFYKYKKESTELNNLLQASGAGKAKPGFPVSSAGSIPELSSNIHPDKTDSGAKNNALILLTGENQEEQLQIPENDVLAIQSADNYIKIYYIRLPQTHSVVFRNTLKKVEEQLAGFPQYFRCHRSYIVNLSKVTNIGGNAQGYKLTLQGLEEEVPVARNYNACIKEKIAAH